MKTTAYFEAMRKRPDRATIRRDWIRRTIDAPLREHIQADGRIRRWAAVPEEGGRFLRVVLLSERRDGAQCLLRQEFQVMNIRYYTETDTSHIEFREAAISETRDLDENTLIDVDVEGNICAITVEHASTRAGIPRFSYEQIAA